MGSDLEKDLTVIPWCILLLYISGVYDQAIEDIKECLKIQKEYLEPEEREIAESYPFEKLSNKLYTKWLYSALELYFLTISF